MEIAEFIKEGGSIALSLVLFILLLKANDTITKKDKQLSELNATLVNKVEEAAKLLAETRQVLSDLREVLIKRTVK